MPPSSIADLDLLSGLDPTILAQLLQQMPDGLSIVDVAGVHVAVNDAMCAIVGLSREELIGRAPSECYWPPEEEGAIQAAFARTISGQFGEVRLTFMRGNGERFPVLVNRAMLHDAQGAPLYFATVKDISEQVSAERAKQESELRFNLLASDAPYGIVVHSAGVIRYANRAAASLVGASSAAEIIGRAVMDFVHPDYRGAIAARIAALTDDHEAARSMRERFLRLDGSSFLVEAAGWATMYEGQPAVQLSFHDVTALQEREEQLAQRSRLESIGRLAGGVAHDFNNLLTVVVGACDMLLASPDLTPLDRENAESALDAAMRGADLTRRLLSFSRSERLEPQQIDLAVQVRELQQMLQRVLGGDIALNVDTTEELWPALADMLQVQQVLLSLVANSRDLPRGGCLDIRVRNAPHETIEASIDLLRHDYVCVEVEDNGSGMTEETRARAFEPFFTTHHVGGGSGLGLATAYGIMAQLGGGIYVRSSPGEGTTIRLYFLRADTNVAPPQVLARRRSVLLLVEADEQARQVTAAGLRSIGFLVTETGSLARARAILESSAPIELVLYDRVLTDGTGPALVRLARDLRADLPTMLIKRPLTIRDLSDQIDALLASQPT
jgi:two-component system cell cycle sensor histidine kinase/response regulator CckA